MSKQFLGVIAAVILLFVGIFVISGHKSPTTNSTASSAGTPTQHIEGLGKDNITLVEYGDYECPYCGQAYPIVKQIQSEYNQQITFQFRNFPLVSIHQNAFAAARAAEAAAFQNKFWEMHDLLYQNQNTWAGASDPTPYFDQYATALGLNKAQFDADYASEKVNNLINADTAEGNKLNVQGTPTFFLDGKLIQVDFTSVSAFEKVINAEIAKKAPAASATPPSPSTTTTTTPATTPKP